MATTKKQPAKKSPAKKVSPKNVWTKGTNEDDVFPTLEQRLKSKTQDFECLAKQYNLLFQEHVGLKRSFSMVKENYEREKNRLDKVIDASLNNSKALEAITNTDDAFSSPEPSDSCGAALCCKQ